jgi:hypothetical protein
MPTLCKGRKEWTRNLLGDDTEWLIRPQPLRGGI